MSLLEGIIDSPNNPLAVVEDVASDNNLAFERSGEVRQQPLSSQEDRNETGFKVDHV